MLTIVETPTFLSSASAIWTDDELMAFKIWLASNALEGDVIPAAQGLRKIRWTRRGMGKRGGARVVYYNQLADGRIVLLMAYTKAKFDNLPADFFGGIKKGVRKCLSLVLMQKWFDFRRTCCSPCAR